MEQAHRVRSAANAGDEAVRETAFLLHDLLFGFLADDRLEIANHGWVRVRACDGADAVERVAHIGDPIAQGFVHRVLQRGAT